ncbi:MAG TPA: HEAT repeat domain-containing protein [Stellaceae bacterium]|jgi:HEAT repeat protein
MTRSVSIDTLDSAFPIGDEGLLIEEIRNLKDRRSPRQARVAKAVQILEQTGSSRVRNAAALALADLRAENAKEALINLLMRPDTKESRGTLLYALGELAADVPLTILAEIIAEESYEEREEALALIRRDRIECSAAEFAKARVRLEAALGSADPERSQAVHRALEYLTTRHYT